MTIESEPGHGTTVSIYLPYGSTEAVVPARPSTASRAGLAKRSATEVTGQVSVEIY